MRPRRRFWIAAGSLLLAVALLYPPWRYGLAENPRDGRDALSCQTYHVHSIAWSRPGGPVGAETGSTVSCMEPRIDVLTLAISCLGIAFATFLLARFVSRPDTT